MLKISPMIYFIYFEFKRYLGISTNKLKYTNGMCNENSIKLDFKEY